jgi:hypothetical protein
MLESIRLDRGSPPRADLGNTRNLPHQEGPESEGSARPKKGSSRGSHLKAAVEAINDLASDSPPLSLGQALNHAGGRQEIQLGSEPQRAQ